MYPPPPKGLWVDFDIWAHRLYTISLFVQEFLAVEMINAKIQFSWNVGAGVGKVTSDLPIQNENNFINTIDKWYHVKADRYVTIF